tara:strand:- start:1190 stop:1495 length:306 start_codon:yes stop_codon:yes gene_type:complete
MIEYSQDITIQNVLNKIKNRADAGIIKYETSMIGNDGDLVYWLNHVQEELMDATNYIERILQELERIGDGSSLDFASLNAYRDSISLSMTSNIDFKIDESK